MRNFNNRNIVQKVFYSAQMGRMMCVKFKGQIPESYKVKKLMK